MRNITQLFLLVSIIAISCSDNGDTIIPVKMSANIDGTEWSAVTRVTVLSDGKFIITGTSLAGESLSITVFGNTEGTYTLNLASAQCGAAYKKTISSSTEDTYISVTGEVKLDDVNTTTKEVSGSFSFSLKKGLTVESLIIADGVFNKLKYTETTP